MYAALVFLSAGLGLVLGQSGGVRYATQTEGLSAYQQVQQAPQTLQQQVQVPDEYVSLLQQAQIQQGVQQVDPSDVHQLLLSREQASYQRRVRPTLSPEAAQQRRLQEEIAARPLREQEQRDVQRANLQSLYRQGGYVLSQQQPRRVVVQGRRPAQQAQEYYQEISPEQLPAQYYTLQQQAQPQQQQLLQQQVERQVVPQEQLLAQQELVSEQQAQQVAQQQAPQQVVVQQPDSVSYSQVQFGSTKLPRQRIVKVAKQPVYAAAPQPQPQVVYRSERPQQRVIYQQEHEQPQQQLVYQQEQPQPQQQLVYQQEQPQQQQQLVYQQVPQQYLVETSKPVQEAASPTPSPTLFYRAGGVASRLSQSITEAPSRSAIFVTQSTPKEQGGRSLTQEEIQALVNAGFQPDVSLTQQQPTQVRRIPRPVALTSSERRALTQAGIRNLYRVEPSQDAQEGVTYVLALDKSKSA